MDSKSGKASEGLWLAAMIVYVIHVIFRVATSPPAPAADFASQLGSVIGIALGALFLPFLIATILSWFSRDKSQRRMVKVFVIASAAFLALQLVSMAAIMGVKGYMARAKSAQHRDTAAATAAAP